MATRIRLLDCDYDIRRAANTESWGDAESCMRDIRAGLKQDDGEGDNFAYLPWRVIEVDIKECYSREDYKLCPVLATVHGFKLDVEYRHGISPALRRSIEGSKFNKAQDHAVNARVTNGGKARRRVK